VDYKKTNDKATFIFLLRQYVKPYWIKIVIMVMLSFIAAFMLPLTALVLAPALHILTFSTTQSAASLSEITLNNLGPTILTFFGIDNGNKINIIIVVAILYVLTSSVYAIINYFAYVMVIFVRNKIQRNMGIDLYNHMLNFSLLFFNKNKIGDLIPRFISDTKATVNALDSIVRGVLQSLIQIIISIAVLIKTEPVLTIVALFIGTGHILITRLLSKRVKTSMLEQTKSRGKLGALLQESLLSIRVIKSFSAERFEKRRFVDRAEDQCKKMINSQIARQIEEPLRFVADAAAASLLLFFSFQAMQAGKISLEGFTLFIVLARQVITPISSLSNNILTAYGMLGAAQRVMEIFNISDTMPDGNKSAEPIKDRLALEDVSFCYENNNEVLHKINISISAGESVALVGSSGAGKSTIVDLIFRFFDPCKGNIYLDGDNIKSFKLESYRKLFGIVPQECQLFNTTVLENILYGRIFDKEKLQQALQIANASEFVENLPDGLFTILDERGLRLSGGQRQRIAIARAVYGNPSILVLDEATSSLDAESELAVQEAIDRVVRGTTAIIIAHRLSTIRNADRIVVLKDGEVETVGKHEELLKSSNTYAQLYTMQMEQELHYDSTK